MYGDLAICDAIHAANKINIFNRPSRVELKRKRSPKSKFVLFFHNAPPSVYRRLVPKISWTDHIDIKVYLSEHTFAKFSVRTRIHTEKSRWYILCFDFNTNVRVSFRFVSFFLTSSSPLFSVDFFFFRSSCSSFCDRNRLQIRLIRLFRWLSLSHSVCVVSLAHP